MNEFEELDEQQKIASKQIQRKNALSSRFELLYGRVRLLRGTAKSNSLLPLHAHRGYRGYPPLAGEPLQFIGAQRAHIDLPPRYQWHAGWGYVGGQKICPPNPKLSRF